MTDASALILMGTTANSSSMRPYVSLRSIFQEAFAADLPFKSISILSKLQVALAEHFLASLQPIDTFCRNWLQLKEAS